MEQLEERKKHTEAMRLWRQKHPEYRWFTSNREKNNNSNRKSRRKAWVLLRGLIGDSCVICGNTENRLCFHEKYGRRHPHTVVYYRENYQDFISMCNKHHRMLHWLINSDIAKTLDIIDIMLTNQEITT